MVQTGPTSTKRMNQKDQERAAGRLWWVGGRKVDGDMVGEGEEGEDDIGQDGAENEDAVGGWR